jgi:hypothetical protein
MYNPTTCTYFAKKLKLAKKYHFISQVKEKQDDFQVWKYRKWYGIKSLHVFMCPSIILLIWKLNIPCRPFKQLLANIVTNNPKLISINIINSNSSIFKINMTIYNIMPKTTY